MEKQNPLQEENLSTSMLSPTNPFTQDIFSLPRASEAFTPINIHTKKYKEKFQDKSITTITHNNPLKTTHITYFDHYMNKNATPLRKVNEGHGKDTNLDPS